MGLFSGKRSKELEDFNNTNEEYGKIEQDLARAKADEKRLKVKVDELRDEISRLAGYAEKKVAAGAEEEAKEFIRQKLDLEEKLEKVNAEYEAAKEMTRQIGG